MSWLSRCSGVMLTQPAPSNASPARIPCAVRMSFLRYTAAHPSNLCHAPVGGCTMLTADEIIARLGLRPHPEEGGFFAETYRAAERLEASGLPPRYGGPPAGRPAIYYPLTPPTLSAPPPPPPPEGFPFYPGDPGKMLHPPPARAHPGLTPGP